MCRVIFIVGIIFLVPYISADSLPEGASCTDKGVQGTCRKAQFCPSYTLLAKTQTLETTICSEDGKDKIVCCTDCQIDDASKAAVTLDGVFWKTGEKAHDKCVEYAASLPYPCKDGKKVTPKKVYDEVKKCHRLDVNVEDVAEKKTDRIDFPSLALLGYEPTWHQDKKRYDWNCQGFIISERFIVTTAHCTAALISNPVSVVAVGNGIREPRYFRSFGAASPNAQQYKVKRVIRHPDWHAAYGYNDIGLVETETDIQFSHNVLPMCLSEQSSDPNTVHADLLGIDKERPNKKIEIEKLSNEECSTQIPPSRHLPNGLNFTTQICYKSFNETEDTWVGSGGRPIYTSGELKCMDYAIGFVSFGLPDALSVYTRIQPFLTWIQSVVWP